MSQDKLMQILICVYADVMEFVVVRGMVRIAESLIWRSIGVVSRRRARSRERGRVLAEL